METCLVTGGAGFIGSWLCESLVSKGHRAICIDNLITGKEENIAHLKDKENFVFIRSDVSRSLDMEGGVDYVFHLASPASPVDYQKLPIETMMANSLGTLNALILAKE
jgi:dTDP-glucose 4,6-dehydratase